MLGLLAAVGGSPAADRERLASGQSGAGTLGGVKEVIARSDVPTPSLPFSAGIKANGFVFTAGQVGTDPHTGKVAGPDVASQTRQTIDNLRAVLEAGGSSLDRLVKTTVFLADLRTFDEMNAVYRELIPEPRPGRSTVEARLARPELLVEIEGIALA
jgi:reactive intermediate/imine deaminase